jgi:predicted metalloprotease with PDZ domain
MNRSAKHACGARLLPALAAAALLLLCPRAAKATIRYQISLAHTDTHAFEVTMVIPNPVYGMTVAIPAWNALYQVRDFAYRVHDLQAAAIDDDRASGNRVALDSIDKQTWRVDDPHAAADRNPESFAITYAIEWNDPGPFDSQLNSQHAFLNLAEVLMYVPGRRAEPVEVQFADVPPDWKLIAELPPGPGPHSFAASSYDALVDAPVEASNFDQFEFDEDGAHFRVAVDARRYSKSRLEDYLRHITAYELRLMDGPPFKEYTFLFHIGQSSEAGEGGMEHANCAAMSADSVEDLVNLSAHEFFHAWNVKRIRPQSLEPVDYTKAQYTRALWFAEGVTSTYAAYTLVRTGLWSKSEFYDDLATQISELESRPARAWQSVEDSSIDAWLEKYDAYNLPDRSISYYNKGQILGVMLDLAIRRATDDRKSLDDVMRLMNEEYAKPHKFYDDRTGIRLAAEQVAGISFSDFFSRYVAGVEEIPYNDFLSAAGLELKSGTGPGARHSITEISNSTPEQRRIREALLRGTDN